MGQAPARVVVLLALALAGCRGKPYSPTDIRKVLTLEIPEGFKPAAALYSERCSLCHGPRGVGSNRGPPLVHPYYRKKHHSDAAFQLAVKLGVRAHHWGYGNMPAMSGTTPDDVEQITAYVRWLQWQVGIR